MLKLPYLPAITVLPAAAIAVPLTIASVLVSPASGSVSLVSKLPAALGVPAVPFAIPPSSTTLAVSGLATGAALVTPTLMVAVSATPPLVTV